MKYIVSYYKFAPAKHYSQTFELNTRQEVMDCINDIQSITSEDAGKLQIDVTCEVAYRFTLCDAIGTPESIDEQLTNTVNGWKIAHSL